MIEAIEKLGFQKIHCIKRYGNDTKLYYADVSFEMSGCCLLETVIENGNDKKELINTRISELKTLAVEYPLLFGKYYDAVFVPGPSEFQETAVIRMDRYKNLPFTETRVLSLEDIYNIGRFLCEGVSILRQKGIAHGNIAEGSLMKGNGNSDYVLGNFQVLYNDGTTIIPFDTRYLPPEYFKNNRFSYDMDMYSIGMILYRLLNNGNGPMEYLGQAEDEAEESRIAGTVPCEPKYGNKSLKKLITLAIDPDPSKRLNCNHLKACLLEIRKRIESESWLSASADINPDDSHLISINDVVQNVIKTIPASMFVEQKRDDDTAVEIRELDGDIEKKDYTSEYEKNDIGYSKNGDNGNKELLEKKQKQQEKREDRKKKKKAEKVIREAEKRKQTLRERDRIKIRVIIGIAVAFFLCGIGFVYYLSKANDSEIYEQIEYGNMSLALKEIEKVKNAGRNADDLVVKYIDKCLQEDEYRRIADGVRYLSDDFAIENRNYMVTLIETLVNNGKEKRVNDVLQAMSYIGDNMSKLAEELSMRYQ